MDLREALVRRRDVYFDGFITGWNVLYPRSIEQMVGPRHDYLKRRLTEAIGYRNKIFHGQLTAQGLSRGELLSYVEDIREWCRTLAASMLQEVGFDGFARGSFRKSVDHTVAMRLRIRLDKAIDYARFIETHMSRGANATVDIRGRGIRNQRTLSPPRDDDRCRAQISPVLSIDLAYKNYRDVGAVALAACSGGVRVEKVPIQLRGDPDPVDLADLLSAYCDDRSIRLVVLDGPQGWKSERNPLEYRASERELNTPAKTGLPGQVKPKNYGPFVEFSIAVFDAMTSLGWQRLPSPQSSVGSDSKCLIESFPRSAWMALDLQPLPAKDRARLADLQRALDGLTQHIHIDLRDMPNHDELQAIVGGLAGLAIQGQLENQCRVSGLPPVVESGICRGPARSFE